jgi:hypothetical protein
MNSAEYTHIAPVMLPEIFCIGTYARVMSLCRNCELV